MGYGECGVYGVGVRQAVTPLNSGTMTSDSLTNAPPARLTAVWPLRSSGGDGDKDIRPPPVLDHIPVYSPLYGCV